MDQICFDEEMHEFSKGKLIHRQQDSWGELQVVDYGKHRVLSFDDAHEQSRMDLDHPAALVHEYTRAMLLGLVFSRSGHATVLGVGGGCLVRAIHSLFDNTIVAAVELRQAVADVTQRYFGIPDTPHIQLIVTDARYYLKAQAASTTDIIFADMYHAYQINPFQLQEQFLRQCHRNLNIDGWLVINFHRLPESDSTFFTCLNSLFNEVFVCAIRNNNYIIYAGKEKLTTSPEEQYKRVELFQSRLKTRFDLLFKRIVRFRDYVPNAGIEDGYQLLP